MRQRTVIHMAVQPVPDETGGKLLHDLEIAAARAGMARRPGKVRMRSGTKMVDAAQQGSYGFSIEMIEVHRTIVDREIERRHPRRLDSRDPIGRHQGSGLPIERISIGQPRDDWSVGARAVIALQVEDRASAAVTQRENRGALDTVDMAYHQQLLDRGTESLGSACFKQPSRDLL